ncbi:MAG: N-acetylmuramoyl-L-alanine amidase [Lachnospiraceae bacterium]
MPEIIIDAGHGGSDPGAVFEGRQEKDDVLALALAVGEILEDNGISVAYTRTTDVYDSPYQKAMIANQSGADFFLSLHRNSTETPGSGTGVDALVYENQGIPAEMGTNINRELEQLGFRNNGITERPGLVVLRRTQMPALLMEVGFINNPNDNAIFDEQFEAIAQAIANGVMETIKNESDDEDTLYRVQVGAYRNRALANQLLNQLTSEGYPAFLIYEDGWYRVQVGAFQYLDNAVKMEQRLRRDGYSTWITTH